VQLEGGAEGLIALFSPREQERDWNG
jgi:hypothetical protein